MMLQGWPFQKKCEGKFGLYSENLQAAEMMSFNKNQILQPASTAMLAQANMAPQLVLQLLE